MMKPNPVEFENDIQSLIQQYGNFDFFQHSLVKKKVTRQIINRAKFKLAWERLFFSSMSLGVLFFGLAGSLKTIPIEIIFLTPIGIVMFWSVQLHAKRRKQAIIHLSELCSHKL